MPRSPVVPFACALVAASLARPSRAELPFLPPAADPYDPYALPDAPAPPTLPDLTHRALALSLETTIASIKPNVAPDGTQPARAVGWIERLEAEQAVAIRRFYVGAASELAAGAAPGSGTKLLAGHPEVWGRAVWASQAGLAYGGGFGVVVPVISHPPSAEATAVESQLRVVRPWDYVAFADDVVTLRPFVDVRDIDGPVMLQLREGIDWSLPTSGGSAHLTSRTTFYIGYRVAELLGTGLEASEVYFVRGPGISDDQRAIYALSPSVRLMTRTVQPAVSAVFPLDRTVFGAADSYWAVRLNLAVVLDSATDR